MFWLKTLFLIPLNFAPAEYESQFQKTIPKSDTKEDIVPTVSWLGLNINHVCFNDANTPYLTGVAIQEIADSLVADISWL